MPLCLCVRLVVALWFFLINCASTGSLHPHGCSVPVHVLHCDVTCLFKLEIRCEFCVTVSRLLFCGRCLLCMFDFSRVLKHRSCFYWEHCFSVDKHDFDASGAYPTISLCAICSLFSHTIICRVKQRWPPENYYENLLCQVQLRIEIYLLLWPLTMAPCLLRPYSHCIPIQFFNFVWNCLLLYVKKLFFLLSWNYDGSSWSMYLILLSFLLVPITLDT